MSGGVTTLAGCAVKSWSNRQDSVALSSGEAEYYACVKAAAELMGNGFGVECWSTGKVRHLEVGRTRTPNQASWSEDDLLISGRCLRLFLQADVPTCLVDFLRGRMLRETELPARVQCTVSPFEDPGHPSKK